MTELLPLPMPGAAPQFDPQSRLHCPHCRATALRLDGTQTVEDGSWTNHLVRCSACGRTSRLALVSAFDQVVLRWLPD